MSNLSVIERYSDSLYQLSEEKDITLKIKDDLKRISDIFIDDEKVKMFFSSPVIRPKEKALLLKEVLKHGDFSEKYHECCLVAPLPFSLYWQKIRAASVGGSP